MRTLLRGVVTLVVLLWAGVATAQRRASETCPAASQKRACWARALRTTCCHPIWPAYSMARSSKTQ